MTSLSRARMAVVASSFALVGMALAGCAAGPGAGAGGDKLVPPTAPIAAPGEVLGQGTVLQKGDEAPQLCLGAIAESYPPQCSGLPVAGWDWDSIELKESASGVTWGSYAVIGTWDGTTFTVTGDVVPLALYDPMMNEPDPRTLPENAGDSTDATLTSAQEKVTTFADTGTTPPVLMSWSENGYLWVTVTYDDGTIQGFYDASFGPDIVIVQSALQRVHLPA